MQERMQPGAVGFGNWTIHHKLGEGSFGAKISAKPTARRSRSSPCRRVRRSWKRHLRKG